MSGLAASLASMELRVAALLLLSLALAAVVGRRQARTRADVLAVGLVLALGLPLLLKALPPLRLRAPAAVPLAELALDPAAWVGPPRAASSPVEPRGSAAPVTGAVPWTTLALVTWALGTLVLLSRLAAGLLVARRIRRGAVACMLGPDVLASGDVASPVTVGVLRPVVVVPESALGWDGTRLRTALAHERAHVASRDNLAQLAATLVVAAHWWNPLAWAAARALRVARESAADDAAAVAAHPLDVAEHLVATARNVAGPRAFVLGMHDGGELESRVRRLVAPDFRAGAPSRPRTAAGMLSLAIVALPLVTPHDRAVVASESELELADVAPALAPVASVPRVAPVAPTPPAPARSMAVAAAREALGKDVRNWTVVVLGLAPGDERGIDSGQWPKDGPIVMGSVIKPLTVAIALDAGVVTPDTMLDCGKAPLVLDGGTIRDVDWLGACSVSDVVVRSSNVGTVRIVERLTSQQLRDGFARFGLASALPEGEWTPLQHALVGIGTAPRVRPDELARAYERLVTAQAVTPETSRAVLRMLEAAVERGTGKPAAIDGVRIAGKTGTVNVEGRGTQATFVGVVPADAPRWIVLVTAESAERGYSGGSLAAPAFRAAAEILLGRE